MATKVFAVRAASLDNLEQQLNDFLDKAAEDARRTAEVITGFYGDEEYVVLVRVDAPHKRRFEEGD